MSKAVFRKTSLAQQEISKLLSEDGRIMSVINHKPSATFDSSLTYKFKSNDSHQEEIGQPCKKLESISDLVQIYFPKHRYIYSQELHNDFILDVISTVNHSKTFKKSPQYLSRLSTAPKNSVKKETNPGKLNIKIHVEPLKAPVKQVKEEFIHRKIKDIFKKIQPKEYTHSENEDEILPHGICKLSKKVVKEYEKVLSILYTQNISSNATNLLNNTLRHIGAFQKMTDSVFQRMITCIKLDIIPAKSCIFKKDDPGICWYIILLGYVRIRVPQDSTDQELTIVTLGPGDGFGEQAIVTDSNRVASAYAASNPTILARIDKSDYKRVMNFLQQLEKKEKVFFLKYMKLLSKFDQISLRSLADRITMRKFEAGKYLIKESEVCNSVYFIKSGSASVYKTVDISPTKKKEIFLAKVTRGDSVNEDVLLNRQKYHGSLVTIIADETIEFGAVLAYGDLEKFPFTYDRPAYLDYTRTELIKLNWIQENMNKFHKLQTRLLKDVKVRAGKDLDISYKD